MIDFMDQTGTNLIESNMEDVMTFPNHPHVHLHAVAAASSVANGEDGCAELACHGCGEALYLVFNLQTMMTYPAGHPEIPDIKDAFLDKHNDCRDKLVEYGDRVVSGTDFGKCCPTIRSVTATWSLKC